APLAAAAADVERAARALLRWNDPRHHYLHCLCDAP
ncbi:signal peptide peptidase SppA, 67K type, partial [Thauera aminoaromatica S2]